jgi:pimeloyl-ACP methyl ester carboxylesterase
MRGYGHSDAPPSAADYNVHAIASDMIGLLQELNLEKAILVGHDWGAMLTWLIGRLYPQYFPVLAALSVPTGLRAHGEMSVDDLFGMLFGKGEDRLFWYQAYHQETFPGSDNHGPAEAEYNADSTYKDVTPYPPPPLPPSPISLSLYLPISLLAPPPPPGRHNTLILTLSLLIDSEPISHLPTVLLPLYCPPAASLHLLCCCLLLLLSLHFNPAILD